DAVPDVRPTRTEVRAIDFRRVVDTVTAAHDRIAGTPALGENHAFPVRAGAELRSAPAARSRADDSGDAGRSQGRGNGRRIAAMKTLVIGLASASREILYADERLTNFRCLMEVGFYGRLESVIPPITVPAWMCMATSQDPGSLGVYGFRARNDDSD